MSESHKNAADLGELFRDLSITGNAFLLEMLHRFKELSGAATADSASPDSGLGEPGQVVGDFLFELARLQLSVYEQLLSFSERNMDRIVDHLRHTGNPKKPQPARRILHITGAVGQRAYAGSRLVVRNHETSAHTVVFACSEFTRARDQHTFSAPVAFEPSSPGARTLQPGEAGEFRLSVLLAAPFAAGEHYQAQVTVTLGDKLNQIVQLDVEACDPITAEEG